MNARASQPRTPPVKRTLRVFLTVVAIIATMMGVGTVPASAAVTPQATAANCGWYIQQTGVNSPYYYKISSTGLPNVTGTSTAPARVFLKVSFMHPPSQVYRTGLFYTDVVAGRWSTSWTSVMYQTAGWTSVQDADGESGYIGAEFTSLDTFVLLQLNWYDSAGTAVTNHYDQWAYSPNSSQNHNVCNAGANFA
ncbi:hypothetical protein [Nakamurella panacisegetis]|nr:hypothetical protein [Nakamurella panacisegetis]